MDITIFDCAVGETMHIGKHIKLTVLATTPLADPAVKIQVDAPNHTLIDGKILEEKHEVYS